MHHACHHCDYDLMGLPDRGACPECGERYDKHSLYRSARARESAVVHHFKWAFLAATSVLVLLGGGGLSLATGKPSWGGLTFTLIVAGLAGFGAFAYWSQARNEKREAE